MKSRHHEARLAIATACCLLCCCRSTLIQAFHTSTSGHDRSARLPLIARKNNNNDQARRFTALYSSLFAGSSSSPSSESSSSERFRRTLSNVTSSYMDSLQRVVGDAVDQDEPAVQRKQQQLQQRRRRSSSSGQAAAGAPGLQQHAQPQFRVQLPLSGMGVTLCQVDPTTTATATSSWRDRELDLDSLRIGTPTTDNRAANDDDGVVTQHELEDVHELLLPATFRGVVVSSVREPSPAWEQGVRPGQVVVAVSATLGPALWPKSTLEGVQSAISSRRAVMSAAAGSNTVELDMMQPVGTKNQDGATATAVDSNTANNQYELTLQRPLGIDVAENGDGYVVVTKVNRNAARMVQYAVQVGDRVVAIDSSFGDDLWPASSVEGVTSACTSRLPGQPVRIRFERPEQNMHEQRPVDLLAVETTGRTTASTATNAVAHAVPEEATTNVRDLLSRCRDVLKRYAAETSNAQFKDKYHVPAIVADKVVDALASAAAAVDPVTLTMIMSAYLSCQQPENAIRVFEAATGFAGDGSSRSVATSIAGKSGRTLTRSESALSLYTATALLRAHGMTGDFGSVLRVLAALEGRSGVEVDGRESAPWPWTGMYGSIQPDTRCYNIALAAAEKTGASAIDESLVMFHKMAQASTKKDATTNLPAKDVVSYNTIISALSIAGRTKEAFDVFDAMRRDGLRPDKYTYTSLLKVCHTDSDVQELMFDMQEFGIEPDVVTYNTMIRSLCQDRKWTQATRLVGEMENRGISPDGKTYGLLMDAMLKGGKPTAVLSLFESACATERTVALTHNVYLYTTAITAAAQIGDYDRALELVSRMNANGVKSNIKTLTAVLGACLAGQQPDLAVQVYERIDQPDGYAMLQGMQAYSENGMLDQALQMLMQQDRQSRNMTGKQVMQGYKIVLKSALRAEQFASARLLLRDFLTKGFVPNKQLFQTMIESLGLADVRQSLEITTEGGKGEAKFAFLLFVLDALRSRNLAASGSFYATTVALGTILGGSSRKVASLLPLVRADDGVANEQVLLSTGGTPTGVKVANLGWHDLFDKYDTFDKEELVPERLPMVKVAVASRDLPRVLRAERNASFIPRSSSHQWRRRRSLL